MTRILFLLIMLFLAVFIGLQLNKDPGYVLIAVNQWTIETTLWFAVLASLIGFTVGHNFLIFLARIYRIPVDYQSWRAKHNEKMAQEKTRRGLIEFSEGYWSKAKNHLIKALPNE